MKHYFFSSEYIALKLEYGHTPFCDEVCDFVMSLKIKKIHSVESLNNDIERFVSEFGISCISLNGYDN